MVRRRRRAPTCGEEFYICRECGVLPKTNFHPSSIAKRLHMCICCCAKRNKSYFASHRNTFLAAELRRREGDDCDLSSEDLARVFQTFGRVCFITGLPAEAMTVARIDPDKPSTVDNVVPVLRHVRRALGGVLPESFRARLRLVQAARGPATPATIVEKEAAQNTETLVAAEEGVNLRQIFVGC